MKFVASKDLIVNGAKIPAGTPLLTIDVDTDVMPVDRVLSSVGNGAAVTEDAYEQQLADEKAAKDRELRRVQEQFSSPR